MFILEDISMAVMLSKMIAIVVDRDAHAYGFFLKPTFFQHPHGGFIDVNSLSIDLVMGRSGEDAAEVGLEKDFERFSAIALVPAYGSRIASRISSVGSYPYWI